MELLELIIGLIVVIVVLSAVGIVLGFFPLLAVTAETLWQKILYWAVFIIVLVLVVRILFKKC